MVQSFFDSPLRIGIRVEGTRRGVVRRLIKDKVERAGVHPLRKVFDKATYLCGRAIKNLVAGCWLVVQSWRRQNLPLFQDGTCSEKIFSVN